MRLRGYTESIEVLIDILDELREIKGLLVKPVIEPSKVEEKEIKTSNTINRKTKEGTKA